MKISSNDILKELKELSPLLADMEKGNVFTIPDGYFESLAGNILAKIKDGEVIHADELRELSAVLYSIQNENVYKVPYGYFDGIADTILQKVQPYQAKVVSMRKRDGFFKY